MIVSHSRRLVFFSNPKTGSESLRALLSPHNEERVRPWRERSRLYPFYPHMSPAEARAVFRARGWDFEAYRRVTVIRNPYSRLVSLYRMIRAVDRLWQMRDRAGLPVPDFTDWLRATRPHGRGGGGRRHQRWRRYGAWSARSWTQGADGAPLVTDILRLEDLPEALPPLLDELGLPHAPLPELNRRPATDWTGWYDAPTAALVARRYAWDLERFYRIEGISPLPGRAA